MYSAFEKQPQEKRALIIKVAIEEFVKNGYEKASTDVITRQAEISKGLLFHYFKSKKNLYLYLVHYVKDLLTKEVTEAFKQVQADDFFERVKEIVLLKRKVIEKYLQEAYFAMNALTHPPVAVKKEMEEIIKEHYETYQEGFMLERVYMKDLIQTEKLREDISVDTVVKITMLISEQLATKYLTLYKNKPIDIAHIMDSSIKELNEYLEIIKYGIYKPE